MTTEIKLGEITIHRVVEQEAPIFAPLEFFPTLTPELLAENLPWLSPKYIDPATGKVVLCVQSYLVRTPHHTILVNSCVGNHKPRPTRPFWDMLSSDRYEKNLAATGIGVGDIDYVMCTHLHVDHVGWNTRLENGRWVPTFPKAKYLFADRELEHWTAKEKEDQANHPWITNSVLPIVAAGRAEMVKSDHTLNELVQLDPHARPHHRPLFGPRGQTGAGRADHRRHDPFADPGTLSGTRHARGLQFQASRRIQAQGVRAILRQPHSDVHGAFSLAVRRAHVPLGRRVQVRVCLSTTRPGYPLGEFR